MLLAHRCSPFSFRYLTLAPRFLFLYLLLILFCLLLTSRYNLLAELVTARLSLTADISTLFSDRCCSLHAIHRSFRHTLFPAYSHHSPVAGNCLFYPACSLLLLFDSLLLVDPYLLLTVIYCLLAFCCLFLAARFYIIFFVARRSLLAVYCSLFPSSLNTSHLLFLGVCLSSPADRCTQLARCFSKLAL